MEASSAPEEDQRLATLRAELAATQLRSANLEATLHELTHPQTPAAEPLPPAEAPSMATAAESTSFGATSREAGAAVPGINFSGDESSLEADPAPGGNFLTTITEVRVRHICGCCYSLNDFLGSLVCSSLIRLLCFLPLFCRTITHRPLCSRQPLSLQCQLRANLPTTLATVSNA